MEMGEDPQEIHQALKNLSIADKNNYPIPAVKPGLQDRE